MSYKGNECLHLRYFLFNTFSFGCCWLWSIFSSPLLNSSTVSHFGPYYFCVWFCSLHNFSLNMSIIYSESMFRTHLVLFNYVYFPCVQIFILMFLFRCIIYLYLLIHLLINFCSSVLDYVAVPTFVFQAFRPIYGVFGVFFTSSNLFWIYSI